MLIVNSNLSFEIHVTTALFYSPIALEHRWGTRSLFFPKVGFWGFTCPAMARSDLLTILEY